MSPDVAQAPTTTEPAGIPTTASDAAVLLDSWSPDTITGKDLLIAGAVIIGGLLLASLTRRTIKRLLNEVDQAEPSIVEFVSRICGYGVGVVAIVLALEILGFSFGPALAIIGIIAIVALLIARPLLEGLGASMVLQLRRPFGIDDQVRLGDHEGTVHAFNGRTVVIDTVDGERVHIPATDVLDDPIVNLTDTDNRRTALDVGVAYDTDLDRAVELLRATVREVDGVQAEPAPEAYVYEFGDSTINIRVRFWHRSLLLDEWRTRDEVARAVKRSLDGAGIEIAFPQRVVTMAGDADSRSGD